MSRASAHEPRYLSTLGPLFAEPVDGRMVPAMRLALAVSALAIICVDPAEPDRFIAATYGLLLLYVLYSAGLFLLARRRVALSRWFHDWAHWIDVGWYTLLVTLSSGTGSIFFFGFLFAILTASFRWGLASGLRVTVASAVLFTTVGLTVAPAGPVFELNRFLLRPAYLLVLGYMMAQWGGFQISLNRKLALLNELSTVANPRLGADHLVESILLRLCEFFGADAGILVRRESDADEYRMHRVECGPERRLARAEIVPAETARLMLAIPETHAVVFNGAPPARWGRKGYVALDADGRPGGAEGRAACAALAAVLEADSLVSAPVRYAGRALGRLFVVSRRRAFDATDMRFLRHVIQHLVPVLENIRLVDQLASTAAEQERLRIARTIHDSVIQPYIGLQIGLEAVQRKLATGERDVAREVGTLAELTTMGIADLRRCVRGLRQESGDGLQSAVGRFATIFAEASGIEVHVDADSELPVNDRLAAELFQMIAEGLSNVRRHARAATVSVGLASRDDLIELRIENDDEQGLAPEPFTPRSIAERAAALGGSIRVEGRDGGGAVVLVEVPL